MDKLLAMRAFVEIVDQGSLTAAAVVLGRSQPTMVRTLAGLEAQLGVRLLRRTTRRLALTEEGHSYLDRCRRILADVRDAEEALTATSTEPTGNMCITAPVAFGQWHVAPLLVDFAKQYPQVSTEVLFLDRVVNLLEEGVDLAVRIGPLADSSMIATTVGRMRRVVVASPELIAAHGTPLQPEELTKQPCVHFRGVNSPGNWRFGERSQQASLAVTGPMSTNNALVAARACVAGLGFGQFMEYQIRPWLATGELVLVLQEFEVAPAPVSLVYTDARLMTPRLRVLLDFMKERLRAELSNHPVTTAEIGYR